MARFGMGRRLLRMRSIRDFWEKFLALNPSIQELASVVEYIQQFRDPALKLMEERSSPEELMKTLQELSGIPILGEEGPEGMDREEFSFLISRMLFAKHPSRETCLAIVESRLPSKGEAVLLKEDAARMLLQENPSGEELLTIATNLSGQIQKEAVELLLRKPEYIQELSSSDFTGLIIRLPENSNLKKKTEQAWSGAHPTRGILTNWVKETLQSSRVQKKEIPELVLQQLLAEDLRKEELNELLLVDDLLFEYRQRAWQKFLQLAPTNGELFTLLISLNRTETWNSLTGSAVQEDSALAELVNQELLSRELSPSEADEIVRTEYWSIGTELTHKAVRLFMAKGKPSNWQLRMMCEFLPAFQQEIEQVLRGRPKDSSDVLEQMMTALGLIP